MTRNNSGLRPRPKRAPDTHIVKAPKDTPVFVGYPTVETRGGKDTQGGYAQFFRRMIKSLAWAHLGPAAAKVYPVLVERSRPEENFRVSIGIFELVRLSGCAQSTANEGLEELRAKNLLVLVRSGRDTGRANVYQLLVPVEDFEDRRPVRRKRGGGRVSGGSDTPVSGRSDTSVVGGSDTPVSGPSDTRSPVHRPPSYAVDRIHLRTENLPQDSSKNAVVAALEGCGVGEPTLSRLLAAADPAKVASHVEDFRVRRDLGEHRSPGWLVAAIQNGFKLHKETEKRRDRERKRATDAAAEREHLQSEARKAEQARRKHDELMSLWAEMDPVDKATVLDRAHETFGKFAKGIGRPGWEQDPRLMGFVLGLIDPDAG